MTVLLERSESPPETALGTQTVARLVKERAMRTPDLVALREKDYGIWQEITWASIGSKCYWPPMVFWPWESK